MFGGRERTGFFSLFKNNPYVPKNLTKCAELQIFELPIPPGSQRMDSFAVGLYDSVQSILCHRKVSGETRGTDVFSWKGNNSCCLLSIFFLQ